MFVFPTSAMGFRSTADRASAAYRRHPTAQRPPRPLSNELGGRGGRPVVNSSIGTPAQNRSVSPAVALNVPIIPISVNPEISGPRV